MARHLGFSFANIGACAQAQVHHSLLMQDLWDNHFDPADRKCSRALGTRLPSSRKVTHAQTPHEWKNYHLGDLAIQRLCTWPLKSRVSVPVPRKMSFSRPEVNVATVL